MDWKRDSYVSILIILNKFTKMVYSKPMPTRITAPKLADVVLDSVIYYNCFSNFIVNERYLVFMFNF